MELLMGEQGKFTILQFTDLHIGSMPFQSEDLLTFYHLKEITQKVKPDLIVITGDLIWSEGVQAPESSYDALLDVLNDLNKPVAITYGNHDSEAGITRATLRTMEEKLNHLVEKKYEHIVEDRASYCVEIKNKHGEVIHILYFIDSGAIDPLQIGTYEYVHPDQVTWFNDISKHYIDRRKNMKQDLLFMHIPLPEYKNAFMNGKVNGQKGESISSPLLNTGLFASLLINKNIAGVFCGHDHDNDFVADYQGIRLCYGRVSGFQCYGELVRGARVIEMSDNRLFHTHLVETTNTQTLNMVKEFN